MTKPQIWFLLSSLCVSVTFDWLINCPHSLDDGDLTSSLFHPPIHPSLHPPIPPSLHPLPGCVLGYACCRSAAVPSGRSWRAAVASRVCRRLVF